MQLKGFIAGAAVVALAWLASTAWDSNFTEMLAGSTPVLTGVHAATQGMTEAEKEAHVAEMRRLWQNLTPAQRDAHRNKGVCPYSGRSAQGGVPRGIAPALRQKSAAIEI